MGKENGNNAEEEKASSASFGSENVNAPSDRFPPEDYNDMRQNRGRINSILAGIQSRDFPNNNQRY
jgi:hypothetical protein